MDELIPALRMLERIIVVGFGGLSIFLGYKLFFHLPNNTDHKGQIELPGIKLVLSRVGPGIFFCAFGSIILFQSIYKDVEVKRTYNVTEPLENLNTVEQEYLKNQTDEFTGAAASVTSQADNDGERIYLNSSTVQMYASKLNCLSVKLDPERSDAVLQNTFDMAKFGIYRLGWSTSKEGDFGVFIADPLAHKFAQDFTFSDEEC
jgi:hypothetical protein